MMCGAGEHADTDSSAHTVDVKSVLLACLLYGDREPSVVVRTATGEA
jgi:hypothetical protein